MWLLRGDCVVLGEGDQSVEVTLGSFYISRGCITNEQFEAYRPEHPRHPVSSGDEDPVVGVGFRDAVAYVAWYAEISGKPFRLPTELEWEFAARACGRACYPWGDDAGASGPYAWTQENSQGRCHPVNENRPSKVGLYGMIGNVWEWTSSLQRPFVDAVEEGHDDLAIEGPRVIRGGGHLDGVALLSCARREGALEQTARPDLGFRICRSL
jgi:formylglycine-generating enzyme required for sulfatase activity